MGIPIFLLIAQTPSAQTSGFPYRDDAVRLLQQLLATGYPLDNEHDDGEWLQKTVNYAIDRRDREIEQLAIRAALPLRARVTQPVSATDRAAAIEVLSYRVLKLPRPVPYVAYFETSLDGAEFVDQGPHPSGSSRTIELAQLGKEALLPGTHQVRIRARIVFGDPQQPWHSEDRELAPVSYALYDAHNPLVGDARSFVDSPARFRASDFDPLLPSQPLLHWLADILGGPAEVSDHRMWNTRYCSELTHEYQGAHDQGGICSVMYVGGRSWMGQMWFRTGHIEMTDAGAFWHLLERPSLETVLISDGRAATRLSALPAVLEQPAVDSPLPPPEIILTPSVIKRGVATKAVITVRNDGDVAVENLFLQVVQADGLHGGSFQHFVIDIPPFSSKAVSLDVTFHSGYGLIFALPFVKGHGLAHDLIVGNPGGGDCTVQLVNYRAAPREFSSMFAHLHHCLIRWV